MTTNINAIEVLDPTPDAYDVDDLKLVPYPEGLENKVIGLLGNNKPNALPLLEAITDILDKRYKFADIVKKNRKTFGKVDFHPGDKKAQAPDEFIMSFIEKCDFVLCGVGD